MSVASATATPAAAAWASSSTSFGRSASRPQLLLADGPVRVRAPRPHLLSMAAADADAGLELLLLRRWRLLRDPNSGSERASSSGVELRPRDWRRLGLLLFSASELLAQAAAAVLEAELESAETDGRILLISAQQLRPWSALRASGLLRLLCDKLQDLLARQLDRRQELLATRLVRLLGATLRIELAAADEPDAESNVNSAEALELLRLGAAAASHSSPCPSPVSGPNLSVRLVALHELLRLLEQTAPGERILPADAACSHVEELGQAARSSPTFPTLFATYTAVLNLLTSAARRGPTIAVDLDAVVAIVDGFLSANDHELQLATLKWLHVLLSSTDENLARAIRLSGALRSLCWVLGHSSAEVRSQSSACLAAIVSISQPADLCRAFIEQGCIAILRVLTQHAEATDDALKLPKELLQWTQHEVGISRPFLLHACCHAIRNSTNALLRVNVVLALQILRTPMGDRQAADAIYGMLKVENFVEDVLIPALEPESDLVFSADNGGPEFAAALLAVMANTCEPMSMIKLERSGSHRVYNEVVEVDALCSPPIVVIRCVDGRCVDADLALLSSQSGRIRDARAAVLDVEVHANAVELALELASLESSRPTADVDSDTLFDALEAARALDISSAWHAAARILSERLSAESWISIALGALKVRHPSLAVRAVRLGLRDVRSADATQVMRVAATMAREFFHDW